MKFFPETVLIKQGDAADCYLLAFLDALLHCKEGRILLEKKMNQDRNGDVRIVLSDNKINSSNLDQDFMLSKNIYFEDHLEKHMFLIPQMRVDEIINSPDGVQTNSLAVKILERLVSYYFKSKIESHMGSSLSAHDNRDTGDLHSVEFLSKIFDIENILLNCNNKQQTFHGLTEVAHLLSIDQEFPIYIGMEWGNIDKYGARHSRHAFRVQSINEEHKTITLINPWDNSKSEKPFTWDDLATRKIVIGLINMDQEKLKILKNLKNGLQNQKIEVQNNEYFVLSAVRNNGLELEFASSSLQNSRIVVETAVKNSGAALKFASQNLKNDGEIVEAAFKQNNKALRYAGLEALISLIKKDGMRLQFARRAEKKNKELVLVAVENNGLALQFVFDDLKDSKNVVRAAVKNNGLALEFGSENRKNDKKTVLIALQNNGLALQFASDEMRDNEEIVLAALAKNPLALIYASERLKNNKTFILKAVKNNGLALKNVSEGMKEDLEIIKIAFRNNKKSLEYSSLDGVLDIVTTSGHNLQYASLLMKDTNLVVSSAVQEDGEALEFASTRLKNDEKMVLLALKNDGYALAFASKDMQKNIQIVLAAVNSDGSSLQFASKELKDNEKIVFAALSKDPDALKYASERLKSNKKFMLAAVKKNIGALKFISASLEKDKDIVAAVNSTNLKSNNNRNNFFLLSSSDSSDDEIYTINSKKPSK